MTELAELIKTYKELKKYFSNAVIRTNLINQFKINKDILNALNEGCLLSIISNMFEKSGVELDSSKLSVFNQIFNDFIYIEELITTEEIFSSETIRNYFMQSFPLIVVNRLDKLIYKDNEVIYPFSAIHRLSEFYSLLFDNILENWNKEEIMNDLNSTLFEYLDTDLDEQLVKIVHKSEILNTELKGKKVNNEYNVLLLELNSLIGLQSVKDELKSIINLEKVNKLREKSDIQALKISHHMVFTGNPGTGKTSVARILGKIYNEIGVLSNGHVVEVDRSTLIAGYVGHTAINVKKAIDEAVGGILFIDEAYSLTKDLSSNDFGGEAIETLVKYLEDYRDKFIVIVAGYPDEMKDFINSNPGLESRFNNYIHFPDYSSNELVEIFGKFTSDNKYYLDKGTKDLLKVHFDECIYEVENFSNARYIRNLFEKVVKQHANRIVLEGHEDCDSLTLIKSIDIENAIKDI